MRRRSDFHKRLMLLSNMSSLIAVIARLVGFLHLETDVTPLRNLILLEFIVIDTVRTRRLNRAYVAGAACLIAADAGASALVGTASWAAFVRALPETSRGFTRDRAVLGDPEFPLARC